MSKQTWVSAIVCALTMVVAIARPQRVEAKQKYPPTNTTKSPKESQTNRKNTVPTPPADSSTPSEVTAAEAAVTKDQAALNDITEKLRTQFDASPDVTAANAGLKSAVTAYDAERQSLLAALQSKPEYKQALADKQEAQKKVDELHKTEGSSPASIAEAATASMNAGKVLSQMEADALAADTKAVSLKSDVTAASDKLTAMKKQFNDDLAKDQNWSTAKATLDADQAKLADARKKQST